MKYAVMSDVHANPVALETALRDARRRKCDRFVFLGDATGYGYDVRAALKLVRKSFDVSLMGNHDSAAIGREDPEELRQNRNYDLDVRQGRELSASDVKWIESRKHQVDEKDARFVHADFIEPSEWGYVAFREDAEANFRICRKRIMFCGHLHHAAVWACDKNGRVSVKFDSGRPAVKAESVSFVPRKGMRYIVNVGSVGYPRNDLCSTYAIWDTETDRVTIRRLPFDFKSYIKGMLDGGVGLPEWLLQLLTSARKV